jgi:hypothetical protein
MIGSGRQHEVWIFRRDGGVACAAGGGRGAPNCVSGELSSACASADGGHPHFFSLLFVVLNHWSPNRLIFFYAYLT